MKLKKAYAFLSGMLLMSSVVVKAQETAPTPEVEVVDLLIAAGCDGRSVNETDSSFIAYTNGCPVFEHGIPFFLHGQNSVSGS